MTVSWTPHRFAGGVLALDVTNTVVLRGDPRRCFDRFADIAELPRFAEAASVQRADELGGRRLEVDDPARAAPLVISLREATDGLFRSAVESGGLEARLLGPFLAACAAGVAGSREQLPSAELALAPGPGPLALETAVAISALSLLQPARLARLRLCANCRWLFIDGSRNRSRVWCDMAVCGNRQKARRHYRRFREGLDEA